jgi:hypothetical protein
MVFFLLAIVGVILPMNKEHKFEAGLSIDLIVADNRLRFSGKGATYHQRYRVRFFQNKLYS